jgi:Peptidase family M23
MQSAWWVGDYPISQGYGCTSYLAEGPSPFHPECPAFHDGIDIAIPCGRFVVCQVNGSVRQVGVNGGGPFALVISAGNWDVWLLHLQAAYVGVGDFVGPGQVLGEVGDLGFSTGCHLHFEVTTAGGGYRDSVDPSPFLQAAAEAQQVVPLPSFPWWPGSFSGSSEVSNKMTRDDWAAFYGALIVLFLRDPPLLDANQPDGEDYYWADQTLTNGPRATIRKFLNALKQQAGVPIPLKDVDTVPAPAIVIDQGLRKYLQATPTGVGP